MKTLFVACLLLAGCAKKNLDSHEPTLEGDRLDGGLIVNQSSATISAPIVVTPDAGTASFWDAGTPTTDAGSAWTTVDAGTITTSTTTTTKTKKPLKKAVKADAGIR